MSPEALRIAHELAALLQSRKTVLHSTPAIAPGEHANEVVCTNLPPTNYLVVPPPSAPLNRAEREFAREISRRVRDFVISRSYARQRIRERRARRLA